MCSPNELGLVDQFISAQLVVKPGDSTTKTLALFALKVAIQIELDRIEETRLV